IDPCVRTHALATPVSLDSQHWRGAFRANAVPRVAVPIVIKWVDARTRPQIVLTVGYRRICVSAAGIRPAIGWTECVCRIGNCLAKFGIGDVTARLRRVERFFPTADLAGGNIVPRYAVEEHISANERNNQDRA